MSALPCRKDYDCSPLDPIAMEQRRRQFLRLVAASAVTSAVSGHGRAETYPSRPVRLIVGFAPGGTSDILARLIGQRLSERLGQQFIVDNRPGAGGNIGADAAVKSPPDGQTMLLINAANASNTSLYENLSFNFIRDIVPVAGIFTGPFVMVVHPSVPAKTVPEFIAYAKANSGKLNLASPGIGSTVHLCGELFKMMTGVDLVHVPVRTGAIPMLLSGELHVQFATTPQTLAHIRSGRLRAIAVTTAKRAEALSNIPTVGESVPGYEASDWYGVGAPKGTPPHIVKLLNQQISSIVAEPGISSRLMEFGGAPMIVSPDELQQIIVKDTEKWSKVVRASGAKGE